MHNIHTYIECDSDKVPMFENTRMHTNIIII